MSTIDGSFKATPITKEIKTTMIEEFGKEKAEKIAALFEKGAKAPDAAAGDYSAAELEFITKLDPKLAETLGADEAEAADEAKAADEAEEGKEAGKKDETILTDEEAAALDTEVTALKKEIEELEAKLEKSKADLEAKTKELEEAKTKLADEEATLADLKAQKEEKEAEEARLKDQIERKEEEIEAKLETSQKDVIRKAKAEYNEEEHGDWESFLEKRLGEAGADAGLTAELSSLNRQLSNVQDEISNLATRITAQTEVVANASATVATLETAVGELKESVAADEAALGDKKGDYEAKASTIGGAKKEVYADKVDESAYKSIGEAKGEDKVSDKKPDEIKDLISDEEWALVDELGVDLKEKLANGEPRYIFAPGANDGKYHIYDMSGNLTSAGDNSLVRLTYGYDEKSMSIIECGNGGITPGTWNKLGTETENGRKVYYMDDCETVKEFQACYQTWSPLSFDLNGDGVQTSDSIVDFDIDGDGIVDKINDSADGVLVFDADGDGISGEDGSELFGDNTDLDGDGVKDGHKDGFAALKAFAQKAGVINGEDDMVIDENDIKFLEENYGFKMKANGYNSEAQSLLDLGITEINLADTDETTMNDNFDGKGNQLTTQEGATFKQNGETKEYADIWHRKYEE